MLRRIYRRIRSWMSSFKSENELMDVSAYKVHPSALVYNKENVLLADSSLVAEFVIIRAPLAKVEIGDNSQVGPFGVLLAGEYGIKIGDNVMIAPHCVIAAGNHEYRNLSVPMRFAGSFSDGPIVIEDDVWIGANCTICDNVRISKGAIIGANSMVNKDVEAYDIVGGVPAKKISSRLKYKQ